MNIKEMFMGGENLRGQSLIIVDGRGNNQSRYAIREWFESAGCSAEFWHTAKDAAKRTIEGADRIIVANPTEEDRQLLMDLRHKGYNVSAIFDAEYMENKRVLRISDLLRINDVTIVTIGSVDSMDEGLKFAAKGIPKAIKK